MVRSTLLFASLLLSTVPALAEPIVLTFDEVPVLSSDGSIHELYPGFFFQSIDAGGGTISTEAGDSGWIWRAHSLPEPGSPLPGDAGWADGIPFDFIGMDVRRNGNPRGALVVRGFRDGVLVGTVTAEFGDEFSWFEFGLIDVDALSFSEAGQGQPFVTGGYVFDDFTYVPEPEPSLELVLAALFFGARAMKSKGLDRVSGHSGCCHSRMNAARDRGTSMDGRPRVVE